MENNNVCKACGKVLVGIRYSFPGDGEYCIKDCYMQSPVWIEDQKEETRVCVRCGNEFTIRKSTGHELCHDCRKKAMDQYSKSIEREFGIVKPK